jgi:hypothetical protein
MRSKTVFIALFSFFNWFTIFSNESPKSFLKKENNSLIDSTAIKRKSWTSTPYVKDSIAAIISDSLRINDSIFTRYWNNKILFVYEKEIYSNLPDTIVIPLLRKDEKFFFNWYGTLFWGYGPRWGKIHRGLDIYLLTGDTLVSSFDGIVRYAGFNEGGYGNCVIVRHLNGLETLYGHMSAILVKENQFVKAGNVIGLGGSTGRSNGPHLHFETRYKDFSFDPYFLINNKTNELISDIGYIKKSDIIYYRYPSETPKSSKKYGKNKKKKGKYKKGKSNKLKSKSTKAKKKSGLKKTTVKKSAAYTKKKNKSTSTKSNKKTKAKKN